MAQRDAPEVPAEVAGGNALAAVYPGCSSARLFAAAVQTVGELGFGTTERDDVATRLSFRPFGPTASWPVEEMTAAIHQQADGARIIVGGRPVAGYRLEMANWHQAKALALLFLDRLELVLPTVGEPARVAARSADEQLETLADLRDRGFLTEKEFTAERDRLLG